MKNNRRQVDVVRLDYQPTKAELEEEIVLRRKDGSVPTPRELARALTRPVEITVIDKPRKSQGLGTFVCNPWKEQEPST